MGSRIRKHQEAVEDGRSRSPARGQPRGSYGGAEVTFKEGDWICRSCEGHNFARRTECFKCHAPQEERDERDERDGRNKRDKRDKRDERDERVAGEILEDAGEE